MRKAARFFGLPDSSLTYEEGGFDGPFVLNKLSSPARLKPPRKSKNVDAGKRIKNDYFQIIQYRRVLLPRAYLCEIFKYGIHNAGWWLPERLTDSTTCR